MIERLRKDLNKVGEHQPGMAMGGYVDGGEIQHDEGHDDEAQDAELIKTVLQKIIDDMDTLEAHRISPQKEEMELSAGSAGIPVPAENDAETPDEAEPENQSNQHGELDPSILKDLLEKASSSDEEGSLPDDLEHEFPSEIENAIKDKKVRRK